MAEKVTVMVLKVDLQCGSCYKKVKKVLCKFPQIRDQVYDQKANTVTITVVCCSPEKIRHKLCYKGAGSIKSIEIKQPPKPKEAVEKPKPAPEKPKPPPEMPVEKPKDPAPPAPALIAPQPVPVNFCEPPVAAYPPYMPMYPTGIYCGPCSEGYGGGPCYHGYGRPVQQSLGPYYDGYGYGYRPNKSSFDCLSEENPQGCIIM